LSRTWQSGWSATTRSAAFGGLPWLDATLNAAMILTGMGPVDRLVGPEAKVFAIVYSLFSAVFFLTMVAVLLAPAVQHFLHGRAPQVPNVVAGGHQNN
jgi:hypothetical protein